MCLVLHWGLQMLSLMFRCVTCGFVARGSRRPRAVGVDVCRTDAVGLDRWHTRQGHVDSGGKNGEMHAYSHMFVSLARRTRISCQAQFQDESASSKAGVRLAYVLNATLDVR